MQIHINKGLEPFHIGSGQYLVMMVLFKNDGINQETVSKILNLDKATIGRAVNKLVRLRYVTKKHDPSDKRAYILYLTDKGIHMAPHIRKVLSKLSSKLLSDFNQKEKETALKLLKKMYQNMTDLEVA